MAETSLDDAPPRSGDPDGPQTGGSEAGKRQQILTGAACVFGQDGYEGASMSRIAAKAGVSKGTLYNYFPGKAELFTAHVQASCGRLLAQVFEDLDPEAPLEPTLTRIGQRMAALIMSDAAMVMHRIVISEAEKFPALAQVFYEAGPARGIAQLAAYLRRATDRGLLAVADPEFAAEQFNALLQTKMAMRRQLRLSGQPTGAEINRVVEAGVRLFIRGYAA